MRSIAASRSCSVTAFSLANGTGAQHPDRLWSIRLGHPPILPGPEARAVLCLAWAKSETAFSTSFIFAVINAMFQFRLRQRSNKFIFEFRALARCFGP